IRLCIHDAEPPVGRAEPDLSNGWPALDSACFETGVLTCRALVFCGGSYASPSRCGPAGGSFRFTSGLELCWHFISWSSGSVGRSSSFGKNLLHCSFLS